MATFSKEDKIDILNLIINELKYNYKTYICPIYNGIVYDQYSIKNDKYKTAYGKLQLFKELLKMITRVGKELDKTYKFPDAWRNLDANFKINKLKELIKELENS